MPGGRPRMHDEVYEMVGELELNELGHLLYDDSEIGDDKKFIHKKAMIACHYAKKLGRKIRTAHYLNNFYIIRVA